MYTDELILTNLHLIYIKKVFWREKAQTTIPINQIKVFEGKPQVSVTKSNSTKRLEIYYNGGQVIFSFSNTKDTEKWATNIIKLISGDTSNFATLGDNSLFGAEILAETLKDRLILSKQVLVLRMQNQRNYLLNAVFVELLCLGS